MVMFLMLQRFPPNLRTNHYCSILLKILKHHSNSVLRSYGYLRWYRKRFILLPTWRCSQQHTEWRYSNGTTTESASVNSALHKTFLLVVPVFFIKTSISILGNHQDGKTSNQIDQVLISRNSLLNVRTYRGRDVYSDHYLVVAKLRMRPAALNTTGNKAEKLMFWSYAAIATFNSTRSSCTVI